MFNVGLVRAREPVEPNLLVLDVQLLLNHSQCGLPLLGTMAVLQMQTRDSKAVVWDIIERTDIEARRCVQALDKIVEHISVRAFIPKRVVVATVRTRRFVAFCRDKCHQHQLEDVHCIHWFKTFLWITVI